MSHTGSCLCGAVTFTASELPSEAGACHCKMCRRHSGGVFIALRVPKGKITYSGSDNIGTFASSEWAERGFCKTCGSTLYYRVTASGRFRGDYHIAFGTLDDQSGITLSQELFIDRKPAGYAFAGDRKTMTEAEVFAMFAPPQK